MSSPDVSVVIAAYNALPYLHECVGSVLQQSIGPARMEVIAVDDGSTDGTGEALDVYASVHPCLTVIHQPNSGGPAAPRNRGLEAATGRYVYFLDADDYLGPEALERLVAMADANTSDVVLGKMVGVNGRKVGASMYRADQPDADLYESRVYWTLSALKLFRRDLAADLRFATDLPTGEDQPFTAQAYLNARRISVLSSYDCYYATRRDDGGSTTQIGGLNRRMPLYRAMFNDFLPTVPAGHRRDALARRHLSVEQGHFMTHLGKERDAEFQRRAFEEFRGFVDEYANEHVLSPMTAFDRVRLDLIKKGHMEEAIELRRFENARKAFPVYVEKGRVYAGYPYFRDPRTAVPDRCFELSGDLPVRDRVTRAEWTDGGYALEGVVRIPPTRLRLLLQRRSDKARRHLAVPAATALANGEYAWRARVAPGTFTALPGGLWDVFLETDVVGNVTTSRLGARRDGGIDTAARPLIVTGDAGRGAVTVLAYYTEPHSNITFDVRRHHTQRRSRFGAGLVWRAESGIAVGGVLPGSAVDVSIRVTDIDDENAEVIAVPVRVDRASGTFAASAAATALPDGPWEVTVSTAEARLTLPPGPELPRGFDPDEVRVAVPGTAQRFDEPLLAGVKRLLRRSPLLVRVVRRVRGH